MMTLDLEAIKARLVGLPEGPWHSRGADDQCFADNNQHGAISHFIANARADVPALIAEVERLCEELTLLRFDLPWHELQEIGITDESR